MYCNSIEGGLFGFSSTHAKKKSLCTLDLIIKQKHPNVYWLY